MSALVVRLATVAAVEAGLWVAPSKVRTVTTYAPAILALSSSVPWALKIGILLAVLHGIIHHVEPFISADRGWDERYTPFYDVVWHFFMMVYAHYVFEPYLSPLLNNITYAMMAVSLANCTLGWLMGVDKEEDQNKEEFLKSNTEDKAILMAKDTAYAKYIRKLRDWFGWSSFAQAYSSGYVMFVTLFYGMLGTSQMLALWGVFLAVFLANWIYFKFKPHVLAAFAEKAYFAYMFAIPVHLGTIFYLLDVV